MYNYLYMYIHIPHLYRYGIDKVLILSACKMLQLKDNWNHRALAIKYVWLSQALMYCIQKPSKAHVDSLIEKHLSKQQLKRFKRCLGPMPRVPGSGGAWDAVVFVHGVVCGFLDAVKCLSLCRSIYFNIFTICPSPSGNFDDCLLGPMQSKKWTGAAFGILWMPLESFRCLWNPLDAFGYRHLCTRTQRF